MTEVQQTTTLRDLARDQASFGTVGSVDGHDVVVLGYSGDGWIEVCRDSVISSCAPGTAVMPLTEPARQVAALRGALSAVAKRHAATLEAIRSYAVDAHLEGSICQDGLNEFLRAFGLEEYEG